MQRLFCLFSGASQEEEEEEEAGNLGFSTVGISLHLLVVPKLRPIVTTMVDCVCGDGTVSTWQVNIVHILCC